MVERECPAQQALPHCRSVRTPTPETLREPLCPTKGHTEAPREAKTWEGP